MCVCVCVCVRVRACVCVLFFNHFDRVSLIKIDESFSSSESVSPNLMSGRDSLILMNDARTYPREVNKRDIYCQSTGR